MLERIERSLFGKWRDGSNGKLGERHEPLPSPILHPIKHHFYRRFNVMTHTALVSEKVILEDTQTFDGPIPRKVMPTLIIPVVGVPSALSFLDWIDWDEEETPVQD